jgi:type II secretory ATPase GspE/PulE/Tfp pilus assembly ATPase PilB-like protein
MIALAASLLLADVDAGGYVSIVKIIPILLLMLIWARLASWADKDAVIAHMPREGINCMNFGVLLAATAAFFFLPNYGVALGVYAGLFVVNVGVYLGFRNKQVGLADLKKDLKNWRQIFTPSQKLELKPGEVAILAKDGPISAPDGEDPQRAAYDASQILLTEPIKKDAEKLEMRPIEGSYQTQYWVDGIAYNLPNLDVNTGAGTISYLKQYAGMDVEDRRKPQSGKMKVAVGKDRHELDVATAGSKDGESLRIGIDTKKHLSHKLNDLGFAKEQLDAIAANIQQNTGIMLACAPRQQGLTTLLYCLVRSHDAFVQHIQSIERVPREELEGITQVKLGSNAAAADEQRQVEWVVSQQPDGILIDEVVHPQSARQLVDYASGAEARRVYVGMRAGSTFDALENWRRLVGDDGATAAGLSMIICGRVLRRLCSACKEAYQPDADTLRKLNMDPARVQTLYQARRQPLTDPKGRPIACSFCHDLRFKGRFGVFEIFTIDDEVKQLISSRAPLNELKKVFRKQRNRFLQEQALAQVEAGETSVQEVLRVLKSPESQASRKA